MKALIPLVAVITLTACAPPRDLTGAELFQANCAPATAPMQAAAPCLMPPT